MTPKTDGQLVATFKEAMAQWDRQKAGGVPVAQRIVFLANILKLAWPTSRETPWRYLCDACEDTGLVINQCPGDARCGSRWGDRAHYAHEYGTPCWCAAGRKFRPKAKTDTDLTEQAAKVRTPTRIGR